MKKAKEIRKKILWFHSKLEQELGIELEMERVKPRCYEFACRGNGICLGYTRLQIGNLSNGDSPFSESNGLFLSEEVFPVKRLIECEYQLTFPDLVNSKNEKVLREQKKEFEKRISEIKARMITGGKKYERGKQQKMGKLNRRRTSQTPSKGSSPKR